jgi:hypothetical protein
MISREVGRGLQFVISLGRSCVRRDFLDALLARVADVGKLGLERGAADEESVDVGLAGELDRVGGRDGAAAEKESNK